MSNILNKASLLLNPAGSSIAYKEDKIYSVFPNNGDGDFTFTGGDGGTRVNQDGYIEQTPANFMLNSGTTWIPYLGLVTVTTGVTDPFSGNGAYTISNIDSGNITDYAYKPSNTMPISAGTVITFSLYMKGSGTIATYLERSVAGTYWFNVKTHTLSSEWQVFTHSYTAPTDASGFTVYVGNATGTTATSVDIAFPMVNYGSTALPYQPTTDRLNYPRITYENGKGTLLQEPVRTNINLFSTGPTGSFTTSGNANSDGRYFYSQATLVNKTSLSPDGTNNAYEMELHAASYDMYTRFNGLTVGDNYVFSIYVKLGTARNFCVVINNTSAWNTVTGSVFTSPELSDQHYTKIDIPFTVPSSGQVNVHLGGHSETMTQQDAGTVFLYGSQMEEGEFVSSYIPTTSATVTRPGETTRNTSASSVIGQSEGTLYFEITPQFFRVADYQTLFLLYNSGGLASQYIHLYKDINTKNLRLFVTNGGTQCNILYTMSDNVRYKVAAAYKANDFALYVNGVLAGSDASGTVPSNNKNVIETFYDSFNSNAQLTGNLAALFTSRLSNTQLEELTTINSGSGGNISYYGPHTIHTFTSSGTFTPSFSGEVEVLVVAGGGSGGVGSNGGGGGGAGGLFYVKSYKVTQGTGIPVTVGSGGARRIGRGGGNNGSNSTFGNITTIGGGGGGGASGGPAYGKNGGSGGGAQYSSYGGNGRDQQGNSGGDGNYYLGGNHDAGGGGGGAGSAGLDATLSNAGNGGDGLLYSITGIPTYYAGGGGGASNDQSSPGPHYPGEGGLGGGGRGGIQGTTLLGTDGIDGLGGGGGAGVGSSGGNSGAGGDGIIIVRYLS